MEQVFRKVLTFCLLLVICPALRGQNPTQAALLEKAYRDSSVMLLYQFFDNWSAEVSSNESESPNKWVAEAHKVYRAFYQPLQLDKIGCDRNEFRASYQEYPYFIVQDTLFWIYVTDTIPIGDDELVSYYTNRIRQMYPRERERKKQLETLQGMIERDRLYVEFERKEYIYPGAWTAIPITPVDSNISFRPSVSFPGKKVVYLTTNHVKLLNTFLGNQHVDWGTESVMQTAYAKDESARRMAFIKNAARIFYGHWGGYWQYETYPEAYTIIFDATMHRAVVQFRFIYEGGNVYLEKQNGEWTVVAGELTWIE